MALALKPVYQAAAATVARNGWKISTAAPGGKNIQRLPKAGGATGSR